MSREHLDGTGGGMGRYKGLTLGEIELQFDKCRREGGWRGISAVLRIAREQLDARGGLGSYPGLALLCGAATVGIWFFPFREGPFKDWRVQGTLAAAFLTLLFGWVAVSTMAARKKALFQEQQIRDMALDALVDIGSAPGVDLRPLDYTQRLTLERMMKATKRDDEALVRLLRSQ